MASFLFTTELNVTEILSKSVGNLVGSLGGKVMNSAAELQDRAVELCKEASADTAAAVRSEAGVIEKTLDNLDKTVDGLGTSLDSVNKVASSLKSILVTIETALRIAKRVPTPVPISIVLLVLKLTELVAQIKQVILALESATETLEESLDVIRKPLTRLRQMLQALKAFAALADSEGSNNDALKAKGVVNADGTNIISSVGLVIGTDKPSFISVGSSGLSFAEPTGTGDWVSVVYRKSPDRPETPTSRDFQPEGWTLAEPTTDELGDNTVAAALDISASIAEDQSGSLYNRPENNETASGSYWWYTKAVISGETDKVNGSWSRPERYEGSGKVGFEGVEDVLTRGRDNIEEVAFGTERSYTNSITVKDFLQGEYGEKGAMLYLSGSEDAYNFLVDLIGIINAAGISLEGQEQFRKIFGVQEQIKKAYYYTTPAGDVLELQIQVDPDSPKIAPLYYVVAIDPKTKTVVYTGTKSFATSEEVLIRETEVRLSRIFL